MTLEYRSRTALVVQREQDEAADLLEPASPGP